MNAREVFLKTVRLAKLCPEDEGMESLFEDFKNLVEFVDIIKKAPMDDDKEDFNCINDLVNVFNEDEVVKSYSRELILKNRAGGCDGNFIVKNKEC